jgi:hypothetical protein
MTIYTGYIYLWYDTKAKLFYLGGHKGKVEDSYICSNAMMIRAYKKRAETFKFRVLEYVDGDNKVLRAAEQRWLNMIKDKELYWTPNIYNKTVKYYNQKKVSAGGNGLANKGNSNIGGWNKGLTKEILNLRKLGLLSVIHLDKPKKTGQKIKNVKMPKIKRLKGVRKLHDLKCELCENPFLHYKKTIRFCSKTCKAKRNASLVKVNGMTKLEVRKSYSEMVKGRKMIIGDDGKRHWSYSGVFISQSTHQSSEGT